VIDPSFARRFSGRHVVVIGDLMLDEFARGDVRRISPEAPVPVLELQARDLVLGGAANAAANVISLGGRATMVGIIGDDPNGDVVERLFGERSLASSVVRDPSRPTTHKMRIVARGQQIVRIDTESRAEPSAAVKARLIEAVTNALAQADACILSDYAKGTIFPEVVGAVVGACRSRKLPIVADPKRSDLHFYRGVTVITPNTTELEGAIGRALHTDDDYAAAAKEVLPLLEGGALLATRGAGGMTLFTAGGDRVHVPALARSVFDVTGAGDTVVATLAVSLAAGFSLAEGVELASAAASVAVSKLGTALVSPDELARALEQVERG
jgi:rfaE bifunctional protein kinase chain/domain